MSDETHDDPTAADFSAFVRECLEELATSGLDPDEIDAELRRRCEERFPGYEAVRLPAPEVVNELLQAAVEAILRLATPIIDELGGELAIVARAPVPNGPHAIRMGTNLPLEDLVNVFVVGAARIVTGEARMWGPGLDGAPDGTVIQ